LEREVMNELDTERMRHLINEPHLLDQATYRVWIGRVKPFVNRLLYGNSVQSLEQGSAIVDEVFLRVVSHFKVAPLTGRDEFYRLLITSAKNAVFNLIEAENTQKRGGLLNRVPLDVAPDRPELEDPRWEEVQQTLDWLSNQTNELKEGVQLVIEHYALDMTYEEIAEAHGLSVSTVKRRISMVLAMLRDEIKGDAS
jgi:RNA polymerase sigma factor (sigma-70 family)